tara:strand:- start:616 stop:1725 length:1110 start_codon:yes stop_codon:yes gene_type:complete
MLSSDYIANLTDHLQQAVLAIDQSGVIVYCNDAASHFWKRGMELLLGSQNTDLFNKDILIQQKIREVLDSGKVCRLGGYVLQSLPLIDRVAEIVIAPIRNESGDVDQAVITLLESTTHQEFQAREFEEKLSRSLGELAGAMAHEIQNPLSGIKGMLQLLQRELLNVKSKNISIKMMLNELDRVERLLKQLLLHSGTMPLDSSKFNIHELLNAVIQFENDFVPGIKFKRIYDTSLPEIFTDRDKLHQIFLNLLRNAAEASTINSTVTVSTRFCGKWELIGTNLDPEHNYTLVTVEDEGVGIAPENREKLFKPFFSTKKEGNGLGLSISFRLVKSLGGMLSYLPRDSDGSVFKVFLPDRMPVKKFKNLPKF